VSAPETTPAARPEVVTHEVPQRRAGWIELATATNHKQVGLLYIAAALSFAVLALTELVLMRIQLIVPDNTMITYSDFDRLLSAYGTTAVVLFALPLAIGIATYVVPLQIGARGVAFPRLAALSFWLYVAGGIVLYGSFLYSPSEAGTIPIPPLSEATFAPNSGTDAWIAGVALAVVGLILAAINLLVTLWRMRAPGLAWRRLPTFSWATTVNCVLILVAGPVLIAALVMLFYDRHYSGVFFDAAEGGSPVFFQHLSWIFFTSAYLAVVVFAAGVISEILPVFARRPAFSHHAVAGAIGAIAAIGFFAWMQNMYSAEIGRGFLYFSMAAALLLAIPIGVLLFNWIATLWGGSLRLRAPLLFALGAISAMSAGLAGELANSVIPVGWQLDDTMSAWQDTHMALAGGALFGGFAALYYWFPKMTGRTMGEGMARISFWTMLIGLYVTCIPLFFAGLAGQPVDVSEYFDGTGLFGWNLVATIGSFVLAIGILLTLVNAVVSARTGAGAGHDPWGGSTLEWFALSPPPEHNFDLIPDVRSAAPLLDIREAIRRRTATWQAPASLERPEGEQPAAEPAGAAPGGPTSTAPR
jgi:heme/copper-type cytochrome/quinol oxidase subunit 1